MSSTAPPTRPSTATSDERHEEPGRQQRGQRADRVGADRLAESSLDEPASSRPKISRTTGASAPPNVVQPTTPRLEARARQVAGVVGGGVDPAEPEAGHHEDQRADERLRSSRLGRARHRGPVDVVGDQHDVDDGEDAGDHGDHRLHPHDQRRSRATPPATMSAADDEQRDDLGRRCRRPSRAGRRRSRWPAWPARRSTVSQPTVSTQESTDGQPVAVARRTPRG